MGTNSNPPIYEEAQDMALHFNRLANEASRKAWALEMAIRDVPLAETDTEKKQYVTSLAIEMATHRRLLQAAE
jgi:hypothetical protein